MTNESDTGVIVSPEHGRSPLLPDRHPTLDLFVCDIFDAAPKGDIASMEHPIFSISTKPDLNIRRYVHDKKWLEITPSVKGLATVHDRDVLIFCISQVMAAKNQNRPIAKKVKFKGYELLKATNRETSREGYDGLLAALERLRGTGITTNIITGGTEEETEGFGLITDFKITRQPRALPEGDAIPKRGRMMDIEVTLSDWVFKSIEAKEVLTLHRDYFRLRKPLERRMYEIARKHCGAKSSWSISIDLLRKKCGSSSEGWEFTRLVRSIVQQDEKHKHFPDYTIRMGEGEVTFISRGTVKSKFVSPPGAQPLVLDDKLIQKARKAAPGYDVHGLFHDWLSYWRENGGETLKNPAGAFIGFCKKRHEVAPQR